MEAREEVNGFAPIIDKTDKILILGSIPSKKSRENGFYYANHTNRFWKILSDIYNEDFTGVNFYGKRQLLLKHKIALYDVYYSCEMRKNGSSLDSDITNKRLNDIPSLIKDSEVKTIYVTSKKAYNDFVKEFGEKLEKDGVKIINLPSPSSANRSVYKTDDELINAWKKLIKP